MDFLISAWNPPIPLPGMTGELLILQVSAQILPPPGSLGRSGPTFCSASNIPLHSSHCRDYVYLTPYRLELSEHLAGSGNSRTEKQSNTLKLLAQTGNHSSMLLDWKLTIHPDAVYLCGFLGMHSSQK